MSVTNEVKHKVQSTLKANIKRAEKYYGVDISFPHVKYQQNGIIAGSANVTFNEINLNPILLMENVDQYMETTVPHELAHLITDAIYPLINVHAKRRIIHGRRWRSVMSVLGANPNTFHTYDVSSVSVKRSRQSFDYMCDKCSTVLSLGITRHNRQQAELVQGNNKYIHIGCAESVLILKKPIAAVDV